MAYRDPGLDPDYCDNHSGVCPSGDCDCPDCRALTAPTFPPRYRTGGFGAMVQSDSGGYVRVEDVLVYLRDLGVEVSRG